MKHVYTLHDPLLAGHLEQVLQQAGIHCLVKNQHLIGGVGDLPPIEAWPEIWVFRDFDRSRAVELIEALIQYTAKPEDAWTCAGRVESWRGNPLGCPLSVSGVSPFVPG